MRDISGSGAMEKQEEERWYVLRVKPRKENLVLAELEMMNSFYYFPFVRDFKLKGKKKAAYRKPLFSGYIFIKYQKEIFGNLQQLEYIPGAIGLLKLNEKIAKVSDHEIEVLKKVCKLNAPPEIVANIPAGERIKIKAGMLKGVEGIVTKVVGKDYLFIESGISGMQIKIKLSENLIDIIG